MFNNRLQDCAVLVFRFYCYGYLTFSIDRNDDNQFSANQSNAKYINLIVILKQNPIESGPPTEQKITPIFAVANQKLT